MKAPKENNPILKPEDFFHISLEMLGDRKVFPFHVYVYNPMNNQYYPFLWGNDPLIKDKRSIIQMIFEKGGGIAIKLNQKETFLQALDIEEKDVPSLCKKDEDLLKKKQQESAKALQSEDGENKFIFKDSFKNAIHSDDYMPLINRARNEILALKVTVSHTVSLARYFAEELLHNDSPTNRVVAVSFFLAKGMDLKDQAALGDLVCASFLHHIGQTQVDLSLTRRPQLKYSDDELKRFKQHPGLAQHLLKKTGVELSERCLNVILDHHERYDGMGFPMFKKGDHIDLLSLILGAVSHFFEFHEGKVDGSKTSMASIFANVKSGHLPPGLNTQFGPVVLENLIHLLSEENSSKKSNVKDNQNPSELQAA